MPRGVYERPLKDGSSMTVEEIEAAEDRVKGLKSPLPTPKGPEGIEVRRDDGSFRKQVGNFMAPAKMGDSATLKHFKHVKANKIGWIAMTFEEMAEYEKDGILIAYDGEEGNGLIKRR